MKVYIEVVILDNLLMTAAIAQMSYYVLGQPHGGKIRIAVASVFGTAMSVIYPFFPFPAWLIVVTKIAIGKALSFILFVRRCNLVKGSLIFFLMTAMTGGLCVLVNYMIIGNLLVSLTSAPVMPYSVPTVIVLTLTFIVKIVWDKTKRKRLKAAYIYEVSILVFGKYCKLKGYLDSGNTLYDPGSGLPVIIVKLSAIEKYITSENLVLLLSGEAGRIDGMHYIDAFGLGGMAKLPVIKPEKLQLYSGRQMNTNKNVMLGVSVADFGSDADMLLHPAIIGG